jgi:hypothetical protein
VVAATVVVVVMVVAQVEQATAVVQAAHPFLR